MYMKQTVLISGGFNLCEYVFNSENGVRVQCWRKRSLQQRRLKLKHTWQLAYGLLQATDRDKQTLRQTTHRQYAQWLRSLQARAVHKIRSRDLAHDLGGKLSPCMCSHSSCPN